MKERLYAIRQIRRAKSFILVTDEESMMYVDFDSLDAPLILVVLKEISRNLGKSVKTIESELGDGRNKSRRS